MAAVTLLTAPEPSRGPPPAEAFQAVARPLDVTQCAAVKAFLEAVEPVFEEPGMENPVRTALERYRAG
jgi:hypothetical protein